MNENKGGEAMINNQAKKRLVLIRLTKKKTTILMMATVTIGGTSKCRNGDHVKGTSRWRFRSLMVSMMAMFSLIGYIYSREGV